MLKILSHVRDRRRPPVPWWLRPRPPLYLGGHRDAYLDYAACDESVAIEVFNIGAGPDLQSRCDTGYSEVHATHPPTVALAIA